MITPETTLASPASSNEKYFASSRGKFMVSTLRRMMPDAGAEVDPLTSTSGAKTGREIEQLWEFPLFLTELCTV
jgi:hypothetical protein